MKAFKILFLGFCIVLFSCEKGGALADDWEFQIFEFFDELGTIVEYTFLAPPEWVQGTWDSENYDGKKWNIHDVTFKFTSNNIMRYDVLGNHDYISILNAVEVNPQEGSNKLIEENITPLLYEIILESNIKREIVVFTYVSEDKILYSWDRGTINFWDNNRNSKNGKLYLQD
jgi:hypothetical protein